MAERKLPPPWIERALFAPALVEPDTDDPELEHRLVAIEEAGYRVLRVVCHPGTTPLKVVPLPFRPKHERKTMKLTVDPEADALYLRLNDAQITDSETVAPGVVLDYDAQDNVVGVEMLRL